MEATTMHDREIAMALDDRAAAVAEWLMERFCERPCWAEGDLDFTARAAGIDLGTWEDHPAVARLVDVRTIECDWNDITVMLPSRACLDEIAAVRPDVVAS